MINNIELKPVLKFLADLRDHNERAWFESNRAAYEAAKDRFEAFVDTLIGELGAFEDLAGVTAADCVFRIYRDIRFSKDKSPYKTHMGAHIKPGGKNSPRAGYYFHLEPDDASLIAGGLHMPPPEQIGRFREAIDRDAASFREIIDDAEFKRFFGTVEGERLKTTPQGYARDHTEIDLLRLKEVLAMRRVPDEEVVAPDFPVRVVEAFKAMKPFLDYLNETVM